MLSTSGDYLLTLCISRLSIDAFMLVFSTCNMTALLACAKTCRSFRTAVVVEMRMRAFALFRMFFGDRIRHFTGLLRLHNAVVSGSVALAFFSAPVCWEPGDLDVYVSDCAYPSFIVDLERHFPLALEADMSSRRPPHYAGIKGVRRYCTASGKRMEIIRSAGPSPVSPLLYFWSSAVVNFLTPHGAVCGYPKHTLAGEGFLRDVSPSRKVVSARAKYEARGFTFTEVSKWRSPNWAEQNGHRVFTDGDLLVVDFRRVRLPGQLVLPIERATIAWVLKSPRGHVCLCTLSDLI